MFPNRIQRSEPASRGVILSIVLVYAVFAACWILLSDNLLQMIFTRPYQLMIASVLKGWLFVLVTSALLYALMQRWFIGNAAITGFSATSLRSGLPFLMLIAVIIMLTGVGISIHFIQHKETEVARLQTIAALKAQQIVDWLREGQGDADVMQSNYYFAELYQHWQMSGDVRSGEQLQAQLEQLQKKTGLAAITLLNPDGKRLWSSSAAPLTLIPGELTAARLAQTERKIQFANLSLDASGKVRMAFVVPLTAISGPAPLLILHIDPDNWLIPNLKSWSALSPSSVAAIFRRNGDMVLFLNEHQEKTAGLQVPLATEKLFIAQVLRGEIPADGILEGVDDDGIPSIGVVCAIAGTDWFLLARISQSELYAEAIKDAAWISLIGLLVMFVVSAVFHLLRQSQQLALARAMERSQAERLYAQRMLSAIADSSDDAIFTKDMEGRYTLFNRAASAFVGKSPEEVLGRDDQSLFPPEQAGTLMSIDRRVIAENRICTEEEVLNTTDRKRVFLATKGPLRDDSNQVIGLFGICRDITERKQAEQALLDSEQRFRQLFNLSPVPMGIINQDGVIIAVNSCCTSTFGYTTADVPTLDAWWPLAYPDPAYRSWVINKWNQDVQRSATAPNNIIEPNEYRITCKDGKVCDVVISGVQIGNDILATFFDITKRKKAEDALNARDRYQRALLDNFPFMVWLKDIDSRILAANKVYARVANASSTEELVGKTDLDYWEPELAEHYRADDRAVLESGHSKMVEEEITQAGRRFWIETYKSPVELDGSIIGTVGFARDITERKQAEIELKLWAEAFKQANFGLVIADARTNTFLSVNPAFARERGYSPEEMEGRSIMMVYPAEQVEAIKNKLKDVDNSSHGVFEAEHICKDGRRFPVMLDITVIKSADGEPLTRLAYALNISYRRQAETALRASEIRFRALVEQSLAGIYIVQGGRFRYVNPGFSAIFGYNSPDEIIDCVPVLDLVSPENQTLVEENLRKNIAGEVEGIHYGVTCYRRDGSRICVETHSRAFEYQGAPAVIGLVLDITARKQAEEQLRLSEERLKYAHEATSDGLWDWNFRDDACYLTPRYYEIIGYPSNEGTTNFDFFKSTVHPDDLPQCLEKMTAHLEDQTKSSEIEYRVVTSSGAIRWIRGKGKVVERDSQGKVIRMVGTISDITAQKAVEQELRKQAKDLAEHNAVLARFNRAMVGRELDMIALKKQVNALSLQLGKEQPYQLAFLGTVPDEPSKNS